MGQDKKNKEKKMKLHFKDENDCPGNTLVVFAKNRYITGNRYKDSVELYYNGKFYACVGIKHIYKEVSIKSYIEYHIKRCIKSLLEKMLNKL